MEATRTHLCRKIVDQKLCFIPEGTAEVSAFMKDLIEERVVIQKVATTLTGKTFVCQKVGNESDKNA